MIGAVNCNARFACVQAAWAAHEIPLVQSRVPPPGAPLWLAASLTITSIVLAPKPVWLSPFVFPDPVQTNRQWPGEPNGHLEAPWMSPFPPRQTHLRKPRHDKKTIRESSKTTLGNGYFIHDVVWITQISPRVHARHVIVHGTSFRGLIPTVWASHVFYFLTKAPPYSLTAAVGGRTRQVDL